MLDQETYEVEMAAYGLAQAMSVTLAQDASLADRISLKVWQATQDFNIATGEQEMSERSFVLAKTIMRAIQTDPLLASRLPSQVTAAYWDYAGVTDQAFDPFARV